MVNAVTLMNYRRKIMALITKAIKGTNDVLPGESYKNQYIESTCLSVAEKYGYKEMRTPVFELSLIHI